MRVGKVGMATYFFEALVSNLILGPLGGGDLISHIGRVPRFLTFPQNLGKSEGAGNAQYLKLNHHPLGPRNKLLVRASKK